MTAVAVEDAITLVLSLINQAAAVSAQITAARAAGQTHLTDDQWSVITANDDKLMAALQASIDARKAAAAKPPG